MARGGLVRKAEPIARFARFSVCVLCVCASRDSVPEGGPMTVKDWLSPTSAACDRLVHALQLMWGGVLTESCPLGVAMNVSSTTPHTYHCKLQCIHVVVEQKRG